jgi:hypothetical protein
MSIPPPVPTEQHFLHWVECRGSGPEFDECGGVVVICVLVFVRDTQPDSVRRHIITETARKGLPNFIAKNSCKAPGVPHMVKNVSAR